MTLEELTTEVEELKLAATGIGAVVAYAGILPEPDTGRLMQVTRGWYLCNGAAIGRAAFDSLYQLIGTAHGDGQDDPRPDTDFNLPDYRGLFLRGVSGTTGRDLDSGERTPNHPGGNSGNQVGSYQDDQIQTHRHTDFGHVHTYQDVRESGTQFCEGGSTFQAMRYPVATPRSTASAKADIREPETTTTQIAVRVSNFETHPKNAYVHFLIRAR